MSIKYTTNKKLMEEATWFYMIWRPKTNHLEYPLNERLNIGITVDFNKRFKSYPFWQYYEVLLLILFKDRYEALEFENQMKEICCDNILLKRRRGSKEKFEVKR